MKTTVSLLSTTRLILFLGTTTLLLLSIVVERAAAAPFGFPGEKYLAVPLPNYSEEYVWLTIKLVFSFLFWILVFPYWIAIITTTNGNNSNDNNNNSSSKSNNNENHNGTTTATNHSVNHHKASNRNKRKKTQKQQKQPHQQRSSSSSGSSISSSTNQPPDDAAAAAIVEISTNITIGSTFCLLIHVVYLLIVSNPHSYFVARGVFQAPLFTPEECETLLQMSHRAAQVNYREAKEQQSVNEFLENIDYHDNNNKINDTAKNLLIEPYGWQKERHNKYPTTDLNLVTDPFRKQDRLWLENILHRRLSPVLQRIYGLPPSAIRANDMFIVRYDEGMRTHLMNHTDDGHISINVLLTDTFEGGGTRFYDRHRSNHPFGYVPLKRTGQMLTHSSAINHEGVHLTSGTRIIFVGFLSVDSIDPFHADRETGLNWYSSWLSLSWLAIKFKEGYQSVQQRQMLIGSGKTRQEYGEKWMDNPYVKSFFFDMANILQVLGDTFCPHHLENLVDEEHSAKYLQALDDAYNNNKKNKHNREEASWFKGQQIDIDIDGTISRDWITRRTNMNRFMEL